MTLYAVLRVRERGSIEHGKQVGERNSQFGVLSSKHVDESTSGIGRRVAQRSTFVRIHDP